MRTVKVEVAGSNDGLVHRSHTARHHCRCRDVWQPTLKTNDTVDKSKGGAKRGDVVMGGELVHSAQQHTTLKPKV